MIRKKVLKDGFLPSTRKFLMPAIKLGNLYTPDINIEILILKIKVKLVDYLFHGFRIQSVIIKLK